MASRSLQATQSGIESIAHRLTVQKWVHEDLAKDAQISRATAINFCTGKSVDRKNFVICCEALELDWEVVAGIKANPDSVPVTDTDRVDIEPLVQKLRQQLDSDIKKRCGTMRVLDMTQPVDTNSIYTDVNILEKVTSKTRAEIAQLLKDCDGAEFDRFSLGQVRQERVDGVEAIDRHRLLMILGRPGAGKTTFLKRLAMLCISGQQFGERVPWFVSLKEFADQVNKPGLVDFMAERLAPQFGKKDVQQILAAGRGLVLLDGLDEVQEATHNRVLTEIRDFALLYDQNQIVITCRIAAREYIFEQFTEVEVADFNPGQIKDFVTKWFSHHDPEKSTLFLRAIEENKPVKELAANPLLLTLLCLEFGESSSFPSSRSELYERGLNVLLTKWDGQRSIQREVVYKKLSTKRKVSLLSQLAKQTFEQGDYFFKQAVAEKLIGQYIQNLPEVSTDPEALLVDSTAVLKLIEAQHGLLTERARDIYSFSHLTFHEYFTAKYILESSEPAKLREVQQALVEHITDKRWREVFLLVVEQLEPADHLLQLMQQKIDGLLADDVQLQNYLTWVEAKSASVQTGYKPAAIRAFYYSVFLDLDRALDRTRDLDLNLDLTLARTLDLDLARTLDLTRARALARDLDLTRALVRALDFACDLALDFDLARARARALDLALARALDRDKNNVLKPTLEQLRNSLPYKGDLKQFKQWGQNQSQEWIAQLRQVMITHHNIGHDWQFADEQTAKLKQYYDANLLLAACLNCECYITQPIREQIEAKMLTPTQAHHL
jgi:predicted NACHT family NTPase